VSGPHRQRQTNHTRMAKVIIWPNSVTVTFTAGYLDRS
jgi:hypothetical protein